MDFARPSQTISQWLQWEGDIGKLRLNSSALRYFAKSGRSTSTKEFLRGFNPALIIYVQGLTLVTLIHRDLLHTLRSDRSRTLPTITTENHYGPMIFSSVSFDGDMMHQMHRDFVQEVEIELRDMVLMIHFSVLTGIISALPNRLNKSIRNLSRVANYLRLTSWSMSAVFALSAIWPSWKPSHFLWSLIGFLVGFLIPRMTRVLAGILFKWKLEPILKAWRKEAGVP